MYLIVLMVYICLSCLLLHLFFVKYDKIVLGYNKLSLFTMTYICSRGSTRVYIFYKKVTILF